MRGLIAVVLTLLVGVALAAMAPVAITPAEKAAARAIRAEGLTADTRFLASDLLEGRGPATRGDRLAQAYIVSRFAGIGLEPAAPDGSWSQPFDMVGIDSRNPDTIQVTRGSESVDLRFREDFIAYSGMPSPGVQAGRGRGRVRGLRDRGPRVPVGRLQGRRPHGQGPADDEQRPRGRSRALRRQDAPLLRPVDLQVRDGGATRGGGGRHHPHDAVRRLQMAGRADLVVRRAVQPSSPRAAIPRSR